MRISPEGGTDSPVIAVPFPTTTVSVPIVGRGCAWMGFAVVETGGVAAASFDILDGADDRGQLLCPVTLTPGQSRLETLSSWGLAANTGLWIKMISGSIRGDIFLVLM